MDIIPQSSRSLLTELLNEFKGSDNPVLKKVEKYLESSNEPAEHWIKYLTENKSKLYKSDFKSYSKEDANKISDLIKETIQIVEEKLHNDNIYTAFELVQDNLMAGNLDYRIPIPDSKISRDYSMNEFFRLSMNSSLEIIEEVAVLRKDYVHKSVFCDLLPILENNKIVIITDEDGVIRAHNTGLCLKYLIVDPEEDYHISKCFDNIEDIRESMLVSDEYYGTSLFGETEKKEVMLYAFCVYNDLSEKVGYVYKIESFITD